MEAVGVSHLPQFFARIHIKGAKLFIHGGANKNKTAGCDDWTARGGRTPFDRQRHRRKLIDRAQGLAPFDIPCAKINPPTTHPKGAWCRA